MVSFAVQKLFNLVPIYFCFYIHYCRRQLEKDIAVIYVKDCSPYVFLLYYLVLHLGL